MLDFTRVYEKMYNYAALIPRLHGQMKQKVKNLGQWGISGVLEGWGYALRVAIGGGAKNYGS